MKACLSSFRTKRSAIHRRFDERLLLRSQIQNDLAIEFRRSVAARTMDSGHAVGCSESRTRWHPPSDFSALALEFQIRSMASIADRKQPQRRGTRIPCEIWLLSPSGTFSEPCLIVLVNPQGCAVRSSRPLEVETSVWLEGLPANGSAQARVVNCISLGQYEKSWLLLGLALEKPGQRVGCASATRRLGTVASGRTHGQFEATSAGWNCWAAALMPASILPISSSLNSEKDSRFVSESFPLFWWMRRTSSEAL